ncbi:hypothetical protein [Porphyrobacter sp. YT40]|uniref:hypothetical protein n=1 Tax=Porphyrobacter sp. YT40 TaxID=2547601 RepID=UPI0011428E6A|nr:hypothetical protein [Porphyrobacter sp. YT40]QDH34004.1 hypothetical protein E2E27_06435 [Porphyrobacter sp. YT40]
MSPAFASRPTGRWSAPSNNEAVGPQERRWPAEGRPAIILPEPPPAWRDHEELRNMAQSMLDSRRASFPQRIAAGKLCPDEAARELRAFADLVRDWEFICDGEGQPADTGSEQARRDALDAAIGRIAAYAAQHGGFSEQLDDQANRVIALRWHLEPGRRTIALARLTHELRAEVRATKGEPARA